MAVLLVTQGTLFAEYMDWRALRLQSKTTPTAKCIKQFCINESPIKASVPLVIYFINQEHKNGKNTKTKQFYVWKKSYYFGHYIGIIIHPASSH